MNMNHVHVVKLPGLLGFIVMAYTPFLVIVALLLAVVGGYVASLTAHPIIISVILGVLGLRLIYKHLQSNHMEDINNIYFIKYVLPVLAKEQQGVLALVMMKEKLTEDLKVCGNDPLTRARLQGLIDAITSYLPKETE